MTSNFLEPRCGILALISMHWKFRVVDAHDLKYLEKDSPIVCGDFALDILRLVFDALRQLAPSKCAPAGQVLPPPEGRAAPPPPAAAAGREFSAGGGPPQGSAVLGGHEGSTTAYFDQPSATIADLWQAAQASMDKLKLAHCMFWTNIGEVSRNWVEGGSGDEDGGGGSGSEAEGRGDSFWPDDRPGAALDCHDKADGDEAGGDEANGDEAYGETSSDKAVCTSWWGTVQSPFDVPTKVETEVVVTALDCIRHLHHLAVALRDDLQRRAEDEAVGPDTAFSHHATSWSWWEVLRAGIVSNARRPQDDDLSSPPSPSSAPTPIPVPGRGLRGDEDASWCGVSSDAATEVTAAGPKAFSVAQTGGEGLPCPSPSAHQENEAPDKSGTAQQALLFCCNPMCINLSGPSELLLKTFACGGGCGVRYCGEECQAQAWRMGHRWSCEEIVKRFGLML